MKIGILGYGNLGRGVVQAIKQSSDMELITIFTRRNIEQFANEEGPFIHISQIEDYVDKIDVLILCGGSATDLPIQGPMYAKLFNTVDSYDNHACINEYFDAVHAAASEGGKTSIISVGWDPGLFSMNRLMAKAILPRGRTYTFWGPGVSQGHSDAVRRIEGVVDAVQFTIPLDSAIERIRYGEQPEFRPSDQHKRVCYVLVQDGYDKEKIMQQIQTMPHYFADYDTEVHFVSDEEFRDLKGKFPHGGYVIHSGTTSSRHHHMIEYSLKLESNPEFTAHILVAYARAAYRMSREGHIGAKTVFDVPLSYLSDLTSKELRNQFL